MIATTHFSQPTRLTLVQAVVDRFETDGLLHAIASGRPQLQRLAAKRLFSEQLTNQLPEIILHGLTADPATRVGLLTTLSYHRPPDDPEIVAAIESNLDHPDHRVVEAAVRVLVFQMPEQMSLVMPRLQGPNGRELARLLCCSDRAELISPLLEFYGFPDQMPPPIFGLILTPEWLADHYTRCPSAMQALMTQCGYIEGPVTKSTIDLMRQGFMFVSDLMADRPRSDAWQQTIHRLCWEMLPESLGCRQGSDEPLDPDDPLEQSLFIAAVRLTDRSNLDAWRTRDPFSYRTRESHRVLVCAHASASYVHRIFIEDALHLGNELSVPSSRRGRFLVDYARWQLETDEDTRFEYEMFLKTKWLVRRHDRPTSPSRAVFPVVQFADFPDAASVVLDNEPISNRNVELSIGARAVASIAGHVGHSDVEDWLSRTEEQWRSLLVPIGVELQIPDVDRDLSLAWKQALRGFGVPSPRRPEFRRMVEAAFPPAISFHAAVLGPLLLLHLGVIARPQSMALHVSIQGDLGDDARYLAFPQLFINRDPRRRQRPDSAMVRVMSKGLVNANSDVVTCRHDMPAAIRTELRVFRCYAKQSSDRLQLLNGYVDDIVCTHLLASAMLSGDRSLQTIAAAYRSAINEFVDHRPPAFRHLLDANYYESTGDPRDTDLLKHLPILRARSAVHDVIRDHGLQPSLENSLREVRLVYAGQVYETLLSSVAELSPDAHIDCTSEIGLPLPASLEDAFTTII